MCGRCQGTRLLILRHLGVVVWLQLLVEAVVEGWSPTSRLRVGGSWMATLMDAANYGEQACGGLELIVGEEGSH